MSLLTKFAFEALKTILSTAYLIMAMYPFCTPGAGRASTDNLLTVPRYLHLMNSLHMRWSPVTVILYVHLPRHTSLIASVTSRQLLVPSWAAHSFSQLPPALPIFLLFVVWWSLTWRIHTSMPPPASLLCLYTALFFTQHCYLHLLAESSPWIPQP